MKCDKSYESAVYIVKYSSKSKGEQYTYSFQNTVRYYMRILDIDKFEARLRKAENDLGIEPGQGVTVKFSRPKDNK